MGAQIQRAERGRRRRSAHRPMSEINVTPFVDVMLVLLVIFMVAAPLLTVGVPVDLPETSAAALPQENEAPLEVTVTAEAQVLLQETEVDLASLIPKLRAIAAERRDDKIFLRADSAVPYGIVAEVMGALNAGGFQKITFVHDSKRVE